MSLIAMILGATAAAAPICDKVDTVLPPALSAWTAPQSSKTDLRIGKASVLTLQPMSALRYLVAPGRPDAPGLFGGIASIKIVKTGQYAIALGAPAWIEMVRDGSALKSTGHQHGPDCTSIRKIVIFDLKPGTYRLQLSGSPAVKVTTMVARWP
jgi:hypothetical protein